jgi:glycosyltransferase involved in cell wall biosynthesis
MSRHEKYMLNQATMVLLTYNQEDTVEDATVSCLSQTHQPLKIIFSDDFSTDKTFEKMKALVDSYNGPHEIVLRKNDKNLGIANHYNKIIELIDNGLIIIAAGDDISVPDRAKKLSELWEQSGYRANLISSFATSIDQNGRVKQLIKTSDLKNWRSADKWCAKRPLVIGATFAFTKDTFRSFGPLNDGVEYEDQVLSFRAAALGGGHTIKEPLIHYRSGGTSGQKPTDELSVIRLAERKYRAQLAVYSQIKQDLQKMGKPHLANKKINKYIFQSDLCLDFIKKREQIGFTKMILSALKKNRRPNILWSFMRAFYIKYPSIALILKKRI